MAAPAIGQRRRWAPHPAAKIDRAHPLSVSLIALGCGTVQWCDVTAKTPATLPSVTRADLPTPRGLGLGDRTADTNGAYQYVAPGVPSAMTLMAVVNCPTASPDDSGAITWGGDGPDVGVLLGVGAANSAGPNIYVLDRGVAHRTTSTPIAQTGWRTIAVSTTTGSTMTIYLDGLAVQTHTGGHGTGGVTNRTIRIGAETSSARCFDGQIAAWGAWDRILTAAEHAAIHADPFCAVNR
jgi:hypothetical protein